MPIKSLAMQVVIALILLGVFWGIWTAVVTLVWPRRRKGLWLWLCVPVFFGTVGLYHLHTRSPEVVFRVWFGFEATEDVTDLRSSLSWNGDPGYVYLAFRADPFTVSKVAASRALTPSPRPDFGTEPIKDHDPSWFRPTNSPTETLRIGPDAGPGLFRHEWQWLFYDPETRQAFFAYHGTDDEPD